MSVFGNQIDLYREKRHLTFERLAQAISKGQERDYTKSFVQHVISGTKTNVSLSDVLLFSNALQVPPVLLLIDTMQPLHACHLPTFNGMLNYRAFRRLEEIFGRPSVYCDEYDDAELTVKTVEALEGLYNDFRRQCVSKGKLDEERLRLIEQGTPDGEGGVILGKGGNELLLKRVDSITQVGQTWELIILGRNALRKYGVDFPEDSSDPFAQSLAYPQFAKKRHSGIWICAPDNFRRLFHRGSDHRPGNRAFHPKEYSNHECAQKPSSSSLSVPTRSFTASSCFSASSSSARTTSSVRSGLTKAWKTLLATFRLPVSVAR